jgi:Tfp pilus assembly protein PilN
MRAVNLLPRDLERQRGEGSRAPLFVVAGGVAAVTAATAVLFVSASGSVSDQKARLDSVEAAIARIPSSGRPAVAPGAIAQERADRVAALSAALTTQVPIDRLLGSLAYVLPEDVWLTGMTAIGSTATATGTTPPGTPAAAPTTQGVTIQGATYSHHSVARALARLAALPSLENVVLTATARVEPTTEQSDGGAKKVAKKQKTVVTFTIDANLRSGAGS